MSSRRWPILAVVLILTGGCVTGIRGGKKYTRFAPEGSEVIEPVRHSGDHFIVVRMAHEVGLARVPDTKRTLRRGDRVGFTRDEQGRLVAVAGNTTRVLAPEPVGVAYYAWYHRDDRPLREFAYNVRDGAGRVAGLAAKGAVVAGAVIAHSAIADALDGHDDDDDNGPAWMKRERKRTHTAMSRPRVNGR